MAPNLSVYKASIIDLDDTLTQSGQFMFQANEALLFESEFFSNFTKSIEGEFKSLPRTAGFDMFQQINHWIQTLSLTATQKEFLAQSLKEFKSETWEPKILNTYENIAPNKISLFPGAEELMEHFSSSGRVFGVLTNNQRAIAEVILRRSGIDKHKTLTTANDLELNKPDPEGHLKQAKELGVPLESIISVGDSLNDMVAAMTARVSSGLFIDPENKISAASLANKFNGRVYKATNLQEVMQEPNPTWI